MVECGVPGGIRTPDLLLRRQLLYPTELQVHISVVRTGDIISYFFGFVKGFLKNKKINFITAVFVAFFLDKRSVI